MERFLDRIWFADSETFAQDNLWVFNKYTEPNVWKVFHNDNEGIHNFIVDNSPILAGYNIKGYDLHILKGNLLGYEPWALKEINDWIIKEGNSPWEYPFEKWVETPSILELMHDIVPRKSLKEIEGNLGMDITESTISFDDPRKWDEEMFQEILFYCKADVSALRPIFEIRKDYLQTKLNLADMCDLEPIKTFSMTNANVVAKFVGAVRFTPPENEIYKFPKYMTDERLSYISPDIIHFYNTMESKYNPDGTINEEASSSFKTVIANCPHKLGFGGLHGALECYYEESSEQRIILNFDAFSFYPSIMLLNNRLSRAVTNRSRVVEVYEQRKDSKFNPNSNIPHELILTIKLILNTLYGISGAKFNDCYDPLMLKSVCVDGQITLIYLIMCLSVIDSYKCIQSNTDGVMFSIDRKDYDKAINIIKTFEAITGFIMEEDRISKVVQRDVNNYLVVFENGKVKTKGGLFSPLSDKFKGNSLGIVALAIKDYFINNTPVEETIHACNDVEQYQMIAKAGSTYDAVIQYFEDNTWEEVHRVNRIFAAKDSIGRDIKKIKLTREKCYDKFLKVKYGDRAMKSRPNYKYVGFDEEKGKHHYTVDRELFKDNSYILKADKISNCPSCNIIVNNGKISIDMIDKEWYINLTNKEILKFKGENSMKKNKEETVIMMADGTEMELITEPKEDDDENVEDNVTENENIILKNENDVNPIVTLLKKIHKMRCIIADYQLQNDGYNSVQRYEYAKAWQYKAMLNKACIEAGVEFFVELDHIEHIELKSSEKMQLIRIVGKIRLMDIDTGACKTFKMFADGADSLDKGIYKAETMLIKSFVQMNFLRGNDDNDLENLPNNPSEVTITTSSGNSKQREAATEQVIGFSQKASTEMLDKIVELVLKIREVEPEYKTDGSLESVNDGTISKVDATMLLNEIEEHIDDLALPF